MADADEDGENEDDEDDDDAGDGYSDDEDTSYKIRRSATKLLSAIISTRPDLLGELYESVAPVLVARFGDREPTVRHEVWSAFTVLLRQTRQLASDHSNFSPAGNNQYTPLPQTESTVANVDTLVPKLLKPMLKTLSPKSPPPLPALILLNTLLSPLPEGSPLPYIFKPGTLGSFEGQLFKVLVQPEALPTFTHLVEHALPDADVTSKLVTLMHERHPRIAADAIRAGIQILHRNSSASSLAQALQKESRERLKSSSTDAAVREVSAQAIGALFVAGLEYEDEDWELVRRAGGVKVVSGVIRVVDDREIQREFTEAWVGANVEWCVDLVRRGTGGTGGGKADKVEAMECLKVLLGKSNGSIPPTLQDTLIDNLLPYLTPSDPTLLVHTLDLLTFLLRSWPKTWFTPIEKKVLSKIYPIACEPLLLTHSLDSLLGFVFALSEADGQIAGHLVGGFKIAFDKSEGGGSVAVAGNISKCLGAVVRAQRPIAAGTINEFAKHIKPTTKASQTSLVLCLLTVGEIGRFIDMSNQPDVFDNALGFFKSDSEEVRSAAAFAVGNIAIGSQERFLPVIVKQVQADEEKRLLSLHALKEVVSHCSHAHLESIAELLWQPLFDTGSSHENALNIAASCLGKLTTTNPARFLPPLEARLQDPSPTAAMKEAAVDKNTVKQDLEQAAELQRSALRAAAALSGVIGLSHGGAPKFAGFVEGLEKGKWGAEFREQKV
ncbi:hypothetical protein FRC07_004222 [Ceratobasidium sp. 392]|nr:hypothetical protein FRC07_004222 [Ceratobasidium sp. 392]